MWAPAARILRRIKPHCSWQPPFFLSGTPLDLSSFEKKNKNKTPNKKTSESQIGEGKKKEDTLTWNHLASAVLKVGLICGTRSKPLKNFKKQMCVSPREAQLHLRSTRGRLQRKCYVYSNRSYEMNHAVAQRHGYTKALTVEGAHMPSGRQPSPFFSGY